MIITVKGAYCTQLQFTTASNGIQQLYPSGTLAATHISIRDLQLVNKKTNYIEIQVYGNYWQAGKSTAAQWGPVGTLVALPGCSNRLLQLTTAGTTGSFLPFPGARLWCQSQGPTASSTVAAQSSGSTINVTIIEGFLAPVLSK